MNTEAKCPHCGTTYEIDTSELGMETACQVCGKSFTIRQTMPPVRSRQSAYNARQYPAAYNYGGHYQPAYNLQVSNHMVGAILTTIFCCLIGGIIAIVYASDVNTKLARGDIAGAQAASNTAQTWITVNIIVGAVLFILSFIGGFINGFINAL